MIESCDTNILLHALNPDDPLHPAASAYMESKAAEPNFILCELVLMELYVLLRNPRVVSKPLTARRAVAVVEGLRSNPNWRIVDYPGGLMQHVWKRAATDDFPRTAIYDARLAFTLRHYGVTNLATRNTRHFTGYGFAKVYDPLA